MNHKPCTCPKANHQKGTHDAYTSCGCRCADCREAHRRKIEHRRKQIAYGRWDNGYTDAEPVRQHIAYLRKNLVSNKQLATIIGMTFSQVKYITEGHQERRPPTRILRKNAERILAVQPTLNNLHPRRHIPSTGTRRRIQALVAIGYTMADLSQRLGTIRTAVPGIIKQTHVTKAKHEQVKALYDQLWNKPPKPTTPQQKAHKTYALNYARAHGWLPPLCWDEDQIDNPKHRGYAKEVAA